MPGRLPLERMRELLRPPQGAATSRAAPVERAPQPPPIEALREPSEPIMPLGRAAAPPAISPRMTAVFGGLFGMAVVASIVALLIQIFPIHNQRAAAPATADEGEADTATPRPKPKKRVRTLLPMPWRLDKLNDTHLVVRGTMAGRSFVAALDEAGVPKKEVYRVLKAFDGIKEFDRTRKNDRFAVAMKRGSKQVEAFEYEVDLTEIYQARTAKDGLLRGERLDMKLKQEEFATSFYVGKDLVKSYQAVGIEKGLLEVIDEAFNGRTSHEAFEEGGVVKVVVVETTALGRFVRNERLKVLEYRPADPTKEPLRAYWFEGGGVHGYVDERGRRPSHRGWRSPVPGAPITSHFNPKRMHPLLKKVMPHNGTDYGAPAGTPVYAAYRGKVTLMGPHGASGNLVLIAHPGGIETGYAHLSRFADGLKVDDLVGTRQLIGYVGSTGRSTGAHLHFSAKRDGKFFDALELKLDALELLPVEERGAFLQQKQVLDRVLEAIPLPEPPAEDAAEEEEPAAANDEESKDEQSAKEADEPQSEEGAEESEQSNAPKKKSAPPKKKEKGKKDDEGNGLAGPDLSHAPD